MATTRFSALGKTRIVAVVAICVAVVLVALIYLLQSSGGGGGSSESGSWGGSTSESLVFAAVGDFDVGDDFSKTLQTIKGSQAELTLALGDLSYEYSPGGAWCSEIKKTLGKTYPFQLVVGNHELPPEAETSSLQHFKNCLPNRVDGIKGKYARQYYFDRQGLARFIVISPGLNFKDESNDYARGGTDYRWTEDAIDDARARGIKWVIVAVHKNCITPGDKTCEMGQDIFNLLIEKKADVVLQGHEHLYARSKPLALGDQCVVVAPNRYNNACIAGGSKDSYTKGRGTTVIINGTGGRMLGSVRVSQDQAKYFNSWNGKNVRPSFGPSIIELTEDRAKIRYQGNDGVTRDSFEIRS